MNKWQTERLLAMERNIKMKLVKPNAKKGRVIGCEACVRLPPEKANYLRQITK